MKKTVETPVVTSGKHKGDEVAPGSPQSGDAICPACSGTGEIEGKPCPDCDGSGKITALVGDA
jgi:DnaJ-class molecular chaperone